MTGRGGVRVRGRDRRGERERGSDLTTNGPINRSYKEAEGLCALLLDKASVLLTFILCLSECVKQHKRQFVFV